MANVLKRIQWGLENPAAHGTPVATDAMLLGEHPRLRPDRKPTLIEEAIPYRSMGFQHRTDTILVRDTLNFPNAYYQLIPYLFSMALKGNVTPVEQTGGEGDYLWDHTPSETATNAIDSGSLQVGDELQAYLSAYMMIERIKITGNISQDGGVSPVVISVDYFADGWAAGAFSGGVAVPSVERINAKLARLYIDNTWAGVGSTELVNSIRAFDIEIIPGVHPNSEGAATKKFTVHDEGNLKTNMALTLKRSSDSDGLWDDFVTGDVLQVARLQILGSQIGAGEVSTLTIDIGGELTEPVPLADDLLGTGLDTFLIEGRLDITGAKQLQATCITDLTAI